MDPFRNNMYITGKTIQDDNKLGTFRAIAWK